MVQWYLVYGEQVHETDMAYPQLMIAQTEMLGDMYPGGSESGYDWFRNYNTFNGNVGENSYFAYLPWFTLYQFIKSTNDVIILSLILESDATTRNEGYGDSRLCYARIRLLHADGLLLAGRKYLHRRVEGEGSDRTYRY